MSAGRIQLPSVNPSPFSPRPRSGGGISVLVAALYLLIGCWGLRAYPLVFEDEVTLDEPARELVRGGQLRSTYFSVSRSDQHFGDHFYWQPPGQALSVAASYRLFHFGIWQTRLPGVLCAAVCVGLLGLICGEIGGPLAAGLGAALLALNPQFFRSAASARMDTLCWMGLLAALYLLVRFLAQGRPVTLRAAAGAGLAVGLAGVAHPLAISWALGINLLFVLRKWGAKAWFAFNLACALPSLAWVAWASAHWEIWHQQFLGHGESRMAQGGVVARVEMEAIRTFVTHRPAPLYLLTVLIGAAVALTGPLKRSALVRSIAWMALIVALPVILLMGKESGEYNAYYFILLIALAAAGWSEWYRQRTGSARWPFQLLAALILGWSAFRLVTPIVAANLLQSRARDYALVEAQFDALVPKGSNVWGSPEAWYAVVHNGGVLYEAAGTPDPVRTPFAVLRTDSAIAAQLPASFVKIGSVGQPLPVVLGRTFSSNDYRMEIWEARAGR